MTWPVGNPSNRRAALETATIDDHCDETREHCERIERAMRTELERLSDSDAVELLLASSPVGDASRGSLDRR